MRPVSRPRGVLTSPSATARNHPAILTAAPPSRSRDAHGLRRPLYKARERTVPSRRRTAERACRLCSFGRQGVFVASSRVLPSAGSQREGPPGRPPRGGSPGLESQAESGSRANRPPAPWSISPWRRTRPSLRQFVHFLRGEGIFSPPQENSTTNWMKSF